MLKLTKLELASFFALQGLLARHFPLADEQGRTDVEISPEFTATCAKEHGEALLKELESDTANKL